MYKYIHFFFFTNDDHLHFQIFLKLLSTIKNALFFSLFIAWTTITMITYSTQDHIKIGFFFYFGLLHQCRFVAQTSISRFLLIDG